MASAAAIGERAVVELLRSFAGAPELELIEMAGVPAGARR